MGDARYTLMTLDPTGQARGLKAPDEFIRHFLIHVLPHGFRRIRHYGLFANATAPAISHRLVSSSAYPTATVSPTFNRQNLVHRIPDHRARSHPGRPRPAPGWSLNRRPARSNSGSNRSSSGAGGPGIRRPIRAAFTAWIMLRPVTIPRFGPGTKSDTATIRTLARAPPGRSTEPVAAAAMRISRLGNI